MAFIATYEREPFKVCRLKWELHSISRSKLQHDTSQLSISFKWVSGEGIVFLDQV
jgi:hypothetical protein